MDRKYPCTARIKKSHRIGIPNGLAVTVLTPAKYWSCCCRTAHAIELPEGYPDPPGSCDYWLAQPTNIDFGD